MVCEEGACIFIGRPGAIGVLSCRVVYVCLLQRLLLLVVFTMVKQQKRSNHRGLRARS